MFVVKKLLDNSFVTLCMNPNMNGSQVNFGKFEPKWFSF